MFIFATEKGLHMEQLQKITPAQYEVLNMLSCITKDEDVVALKNVIVQFLNTRLQNELDKLWESGTLTDEKVASWGSEHMRTPYKKIAQWKDTLYFNVLNKIPFPHIVVKRLQDFYEELVKNL